MENFFYIIFLLFIGVLIRKNSFFPENTAKVLNLFVIYISLPALILYKIQELHFSSELWIPIFMPYFMLGLSVISIYIISKIRKWERKVTACMLLLIPLGNTSFLGIPMVESFFGKDAIPYVLLYDQLGSFLLLSTYGSIIISVYSNSPSNLSLKQVLLKILSFPPLIFLCLAFVLKPFSYPAIFQSILKNLSSTLIPLVMIAVGFQLELRPNKSQLGFIGTGLFIKLILAPLVALSFCKLFGFKGKAALVSIFEAGM
ncbi:MAG: AEC family transporter, partial [Leptospiraceae bacterium]|nr:AEC family transporter [Leptospiraceae bacterium]